MKYRCFLSYDHKDHALGMRLRAALEELGHDVIWDGEIRPGVLWRETLEQMISYAHFVVPLVTPSSQNSAWVHEEVGYALGLNLPIISVAVNAEPLQEMAGRLQALRFDANAQGLEGALESVDFQAVVTSAGASPTPMRVEVARLPEERPILIARIATELSAARRYATVRKRTRLSAFAIPDKPPSSPLWATHYPKRQLSEQQRVNRRAERRALSVHAKEAGCRLILHLDLTDSLDQLGGASVAVAKLETLRTFFEQMPDEKVQAVFSRTPPHGTLTILGDYMKAEALAYAEGGFHQTIVTRHAPTVLQSVNNFDDEFADYADSQPTDRVNAVHKINDEIAKWK
jgi:hypothetical protein